MVIQIVIYSREWRRLHLAHMITIPISVACGRALPSHYIKIYHWKKYAFRATGRNLHVRYTSFTYCNSSSHHDYLLLLLLLLHYHAHCQGAGGSSPFPRYSGASLCALVTVYFSSQLNRLVGSTLAPLAPAGGSDVDVCLVFTNNIFSFFSF